MARRTLFTRIRHAIFGAPLTHEQMRAREEATSALTRSRAISENHAQAMSLTNQAYFF